MVEATTAIIGLLFTVLGALVVGIWRFASLATRIDLTLKDLRERIDEFDAFEDKVQQVPELARRVGQLEETTREVVPRLAVVEKVVSNRAMRAVRSPHASRPAIPREDGDDE